MSRWRSNVVLLLFLLVFSTSSCSRVEGGSKLRVVHTHTHTHAYNNTLAHTYIHTHTLARNKSSNAHTRQERWLTSWGPSLFHRRRRHRRRRRRGRRRRWWHRHHRHPPAAINIITHRIIIIISVTRVSRTRYYRCCCYCCWINKDFCVLCTRPPDGLAGRIVAVTITLKTTSGQKPRARAPE